MPKKDLLKGVEKISSWEYLSKKRKKIEELYFEKVREFFKKQKFTVSTEYYEGADRVIATLCQKCGEKKIQRGYWRSYSCPSCKTAETFSFAVIEESNEELARILVFKASPEFTVPPVNISDPFDCLYQAEITGMQLSGQVSRYVFSWRYGLFNIPFDSGRLVLSPQKLSKELQFLKTEAFPDFEDRLSDYLVPSIKNLATQINDVAEQIVLSHKRPAKKSTKIDDLYHEFSKVVFLTDEEKMSEIAGDIVAKTGEPFVITESLDGFFHNLTAFCPHCLTKFNISVDVQQNKKLFEEEPGASLDMVCPKCGKARTVRRTYFVSPRRPVCGYMRRDVNFADWKRFDENTLVVRFLTLAFAYDEKRGEIYREINETYRTFITPTRMFLFKNVSGSFKKESFTSFYAYPYEKRMLLTPKEELIDMIENSNFKYVGLLEAWGLKGDMKPLETPGNFEKTSYVYTWVKEHCLEQLLKTGFRKIVKDLCYNKGRSSNLSDKKATSTPKILGVPRPVMRIAAALDASFSELEKIKRLYEKDPQTSEQSFRYIIDKNIESSKLCVIYDTLSIPINRQIEYIKTAEQMQCITPAARVAEIWSDYIRMAKECGYRLKDREKRYPSSLIREHAIISTVYSCIRRDFDQKKFAEKAAENSRFNYSNKELGLFAVAPKTPEEVVDEGMSLHHCVSSYVNPIIMGASVVMFIRQYEDEDTPYYTVEIRAGSPSAIVQVKGDMNTDPDPTTEEGKKIKAFLRKWCNFKGLVLDLG